MVSEELLINIIAKLQGGGFDQALQKLQDLKSAASINFDKISDNYKTVTNKMATDSAQVRQIATDELSKINVGDFNRITSNFKSSTSSIANDSRITSQIATAELSKIDTINFNKINNGFRSISDLISRDSRTASQIATTELSKINTIDFNKLSTNFKASAQQMDNDAKSTSDGILAQFSKLTGIDFSNVSNKFKAVTEKMTSDAKAAATSISQEFQNMGNSISGALAGMGGALATDKLFQEANNRAATFWRLNNRYGTEANRIMNEFVNYDIASARPDHDLIQMFEWLSNSGELAKVNVKEALAVYDAISASGDPLRQRGKQMAYGRYLSSGFEAAKLMFRDEGLSDSQLDKLKQANTLEERLNALREIGIEQGAIQIGQNGQIIGQYNTLEGDLGGYNELLSLIDVLVQGATLAFMDLMNILRPVISTLKDFVEGNQGLAGGLIIAGIAITGVIGILSVLGAIVPAVTGGIGILASVLPVGAASMSLAAVAAGEASLSFGLLGSAIWAALSPVLPFIAAAAAIVGAVYLIGDALGYWKDMPTMFAAISDGLSRIWNSFVNNEHVVGVINAITSAWDDFVNFFVDGWNSIFGQDIGGDFDVVRGIIDVFGLLGDAIAGVWDYLANDPVGQFITTLLTMGNPILFVATHFDWLKSTVMDVWNFINGAVQNNPLVNILSWITPLGVLLFHLNDLKQMFGALQQAWNEFVSSTEGRELFSSLSEAWAELQSAFGEIGAAFGELWNVLFPPDTASKGESAKQAVNGVTSAIQKANPYIETAKTIIHGFAWVLQNLVLPTVRGMAIVFRAVADAVKWVADGIQWLREKWDEFASGDFDIGKFIVESFLALPGLVQGVLSIVLGTIAQWTMQLAMMGLTAGVQFVTNILTSISQLPSMIWNWLMMTINRVVQFGANILSRVRSIFSSVVNTAKSLVSQLPGIVWQEMMNVANKIGGAADYIFQQVQNTFGNIVYWAKKALGIASPGFITRAMSGEMGYLVTAIVDKASVAYNATKNLASSIVSGFGNPVLPRIENEGVAPWDINYDPGKPKWPSWPWDDGPDYPVPSSAGSVILKNDSASKDAAVNVEVKQEHTWHIDGSSGDPQEIAQQVEQTLAASLPPSIVEALIKGLNRNNISNGNI